jgi:hypothetical protein
MYLVSISSVRVRDQQRGWMEPGRRLEAGEPQRHEDDTGKTSRDSTAAGLRSAGEVAGRAMLLPWSGTGILVAG